MGNGTNSPSVPAVDPQKVAMIANLAGQQGANVQPPSSPVGPTSPFDIASLVSQVSSLPEYQKPVGRLEDIGAQEKAIQDQMANLQVPKMGFQPNFQPHHFLHNLGQALMAVAASTAPGREVQETVYGPGIRSYGAKRQQLADQLAALRGQQEVPTEELRGVTGLTGAASTGLYRGGMLNVAEEKTRIAQQKADTYAQSVQNHLALGLKNLDIRQLLAGSTIELNKAKVLLDNVMAQVAPQKLELEQYGIDTNNATRQAVSNAMAQLGMDRSHPVAQMLDNLLGTSLTPAAPQTPGGAQPVQGTTPLPPRTPARTPAKPPTKPAGGGNKIVVTPEDMK